MSDIADQNKTTIRLKPKSGNTISNSQTKILCAKCKGLLIIASTVIGELKCHRCNHMNSLHIVAQADIAKMFT